METRINNTNRKVYNRVKTILDIFLTVGLMFLMYHLYIQYQKSCPPLDVVESCYKCTGQVIPLDELNNITNISIRG